MNPKGWSFFFDLIEKLSRHAYELGYEDGKKKNPQRNQGFRPSRASQLSIKTNFEKVTKNR